MVETRAVELTPEELRFVALHEAAHAVVAVHLGVPVQEIKVGIEDNHAGSVLHTAPPVRAFRAMAGDAFRSATDHERRYDAAYLQLCVLFAGSVVADRHDRLDSHSDYERAIALTNELGLSDAKAKRLNQRAWKRAAGILKRRSNAVLRLATEIAALGPSGVLSGEQVARLLRRRRAETYCGPREFATWLQCGSPRPLPLP